MKYSTFYQLIDKLRIDKGFTISEFCDGIISERTYLRHNKSDHNFKFSNFHALLKRLDLDLSQFLIYMAHFAETDTGTNRFFLRVHSRHFNDIGPIYDLILKYTPENYYDNLIVQTYIFRYRYLIKEITLDTFLLEISKLLKNEQNENQNHFVIRHVNLIRQMYDNDNRIIDVDEFALYLINYNSNLYLFNYILTIDNMLDYCMANDCLNLDSFMRLVNKLQYYSQYLNVKDYECSIELYLAYFYYKIKDFKKRDAFLWQSVLNAITIMGKDQFLTYEKKINETFNIDVDNFIYQQVKTLFQ